jgi:hypothetical protein
MIRPYRVEDTLTLLALMRRHVPEYFALYVQIKLEQYFLLEAPGFDLYQMKMPLS